MLDLLYDRVVRETNKSLVEFFDQKIAASFSDERALYRLLSDFCLRGGKRLRAYLAVLGYTAYGGRPIQKMIPVATALELLHAAVLIHDDIIDHDDERRGMPSLHRLYKKYGVARAIFASDALTGSALEILASAPFPAEYKIRAGKYLASMAVETGIGQAMDILYSFQTQHTEEKIANIIHLKTSQYTTTGPLLLGAIFAGADEKKLLPLRNVGDHLGAAFQLHDDYLGVFGKSIGKPLWSDIREGKPTYLMNLMEKKISLRETRQLKKIYAKKRLTKSDVRFIFELMQRTHAGEATLKKIQKEVDLAHQSIARLPVPRLTKKRIEEFAHYLLTRTR